MTVLVVSHWPIFRQGVGACLAAIPYVVPCGEAGNPRAARQFCAEKQPDAIVLDDDWPDHDGGTLLRDFKRLHPPVRTLVLSKRTDALSLRAAFRAGAGAYASKVDEVSETAETLDNMMRCPDERFVSAAISKALVLEVAEGGILGKTVNDLPALTKREQEVFRLLGLGYGPSASARALGISVKTVESHHHRIKGKLDHCTGEDLKRRAAAWMLAHGPRRAARPPQD